MSAAQEPVTGTPNTKIANRMSVAKLERPIRT